MGDSVNSAVSGAYFIGKLRKNPLLVKSTYLHDDFLDVGLLSLYPFIEIPVSCPPISDSNNSRV